VYLYHCDHLGTPLRLTAGDGRVVWSGAYSAFGEFHPVMTEVPNPLRAPGQYHDAETGLYYNRFRYYSPALGRYVSRDPVSFLEGPNLYLYVGNDPVNRADPLGLWWKAAVSVLAGVAVAAAVVLTAPVSVPALALAAGAAALGVGVGIGLNKALNLKEFCPSSFLSAFAQGFFMGVGITALGIAAALLFPAAATAIAVGGTIVGIGLMLNEHLGLVDLGPLGGGKSFDQMTPAEQNQSLGGLLGGLTGSVATGAGAKYAAGKLSTAPPPPDPETVAKAGDPSEVLTNRTSEHPYRNPPEMHTVRPGAPLDVNALDPNQTYLWAVDEEGNVRVAPEEQEGFGRPVKHGDLVPGPDGESRGAARSGGELNYNPDTQKWEMNNDSSYTFNRTDGQHLNGDHLNAAHDLLTQSGTDTSDIDTVNSHGSDAQPR
jgi:RHS repeat-associated protein